MKNNNISLTCAQRQRPDDWQVTNDGVMGGLSLGKVQQDNKKFIFSGTISTENYGGFTCVFKRSPKLSEDIGSINICIIGDGNCYQLRLRSLVMGYELDYKKSFETKSGEMENYTFNLADFNACFRGRLISNSPPLKATQISHVGFLINAKQPLNFSLSVHAIDFSP